MRQGFIWAKHKPFILYKWGFKNDRLRFTGKSVTERQVRIQNYKTDALTKSS